MLQQSVGGWASSVKPGKYGACHVCQRTLAELCCLTTGADVKSNRHSGEAEGDASSHQAAAVDGTGSLDTFLTMFQHMASYLWCDEDMFHMVLRKLQDKSSGTSALV